MGKKTAKTAPIPDPIELINAQKEANRINQTTPFGQTTFGEDGQTFSFSPELQGLFDQAVNIAQPLGVDNAFEDLAFDRAQNLIDRDFGIREDRFRQRLANQGIPVDSDAFSQAFRTEIADPRERAIESAAFNAIQAGDLRRTQDFSILASLLGRGQPTPITPIDTNSAFQLKQQQLNANAQAENQAKQAIFGNLTKLATIPFIL